MSDSTSKKKKVLQGTAIIAVLGIAGFLILTSPATWSLTRPDRDVADSEPPDLANGKTQYIAGDCTTCHATPGQDDDLHLGGGRALDTEFGIFHMPNISPDPEDGIGSWTLAEFTRAMREGVGPGGILPDGQNLYPAFPYTSYQRMTANDVRDLFAYIETLEPVQSTVPDHELKFPYNMRRGVGIWRLAFLDGKPAVHEPDNTTAELASAVDPEVLKRGHYLVEGPGHCAECHSPRTFIGTIEKGMRYSGGVNPEATGYYPNITPDETGIGFWSANSIANYLKNGVSPVNKVAGGDMSDVVHNTSQLSDEDRYAIAAYLKTVSSVRKPNPGVPEPNFSKEIVMLPQQEKKVVNLPASEDSEIAQADVLYVSNTKPFYIDKNKSGEEEDGKLLAAARLTVLERDGDMIKVALDGWQLSGAEPVFYAENGQRILQAVLANAAIATVERQDPVMDPDTEQEWSESHLEVWVEGSGLATALPDLWSYSSDLYGRSCSICHSLPKADDFLANQWTGNLKAMKRFTSLTDDQYRLLLAYLQNHSKDVGSAEETL